MTVAPSAPAPAPPKGFRPHIGMRVRLEVVLEQDGRCPKCGERLGKLDGLQFDHTPPLAMRPWCEATGDTIPPASDPKHIQAIHVDCHAIKTSGRRTKARAEGDQTEIARTQRLADEQAAFRARLLAKAPGEKRARKGTIRSRGFNTNRKGKT